MVKGQENKSLPYLPTILAAEGAVKASLQSSFFPGASPEKLEDLHRFTKSYLDSDTTRYFQN